MSRLVPRFPHGPSPRNAFAIWSPVVKCVFLACFLLFSRAFLLDSHGRLAFPRANGGTGTSNAVPVGLYQDGTLPVGWNPMVAINLTDKLDDYVPIPYYQMNEANGGKQADGKNTNSVETNGTLPDRLSSAIHDLAATQREVPRNLNLRQEEYYTTDTTLPAQADNAHSFLSKENVILSSDGTSDTMVNEPSMKDIDGDSDDAGILFALKIWANNMEHLRDKVGWVDYRQASTGVKCLPDN